MCGASTTVDLLRAQQEGTGGVARRRQARLAALLAHARARSPYYRQLYRGLRDDRVDLGDLPPVTKGELMASFDAWVTDPAVTRTGVEAFVSDPDRVGLPYLGRYFVCSSSGTTGRPGLFVHDEAARAVYQAMTYRLDLAWLSGRQWVQMLRQHTRWATVVGTGGHFAAEGWMELQRRRDPWRRRNFRVFTLMQPFDRLVAALNAFDPAVLTGYPSVLELLAEEQTAGGLRLRPVVVELGGESLDDVGRARIAAGLGVPLHDVYSASECLVMAFDCDQGWLHVNSDWVVLEPVGPAYAPTPPGERSHTVLLTNLANRVQPIIRYDLGDSVVARPDPCPCGRPFPAIRVEGRRDDVLRLTTAAGGTVSVPPLAIGAVVDETAGVLRSQLLQTGPATLRLRLDVAPGAPADGVWDAACASLARYLAGQGLAGVDVVRAAEAPEVSLTSGKFRQVVSAPR